MDTSRPCREFSSSGKCRFGARCKFSHTPVNGRPPASPGASSSVARGGPIRSPASRAMAPGAVTPAPPSSTTDLPCPPGVCRSFWTAGTCHFKDRCKFRHQHHAAAGQGAAEEGVDEEPLVTTISSNAVPGTGADAFIVGDDAQQSAGESLSALSRRFLKEDYRFERAAYVYAFMKILSSATRTNKLWNEEEGQLLLADMTKDTGLLRLSEIINWSDVALNTRPNSQVLSFQRGYAPLIGYLASDFVVGSSIGHRVNTLYMVLINNLEPFIEKVTVCVEQGLQARTFRDQSLRGGSVAPESHFFASLSTVLFEILNRFKNVIVKQPTLSPFINKANEWFTTWVTEISATPPRFADPFKDIDLGHRENLLTHMKSKFTRILAIVDREQAKFVRRSEEESGQGKRRVYLTHEGHVAALENSYEGPGSERPGGPRHDNDFVDIAQIRIAPTSQELQCRIDPFLPGNFYQAPHPLPAGSIDRLLDVQFRLLREELTAPLRTSVQLVIDDLHLLDSGSKKEIKTCKLKKILDNQGGRYRGEGQDSVMFGIYTDVKFSSMVADRSGMSTELVVSAPPAARLKDAKSRAAFWERTGGKRLMQGGLVALVWKIRDETSIFLATIASRGSDIVASAKQSKDTVTVRLVLFDPEAELRVLQILKKPELDHGAQRLLIEAPVMFESIRPFLEALRSEPENLPFRDYLVHHPQGHLKNMVIEPPTYARRRDFSFQLASLFDADAGVTDLQLSVSNPVSVENARKVLREKSRLDASQAEAMVDTLTREVALIQGPPGTGKSYTGVELLRVLLANKAGPVLLIALTNHALDHLLSAVLEKKITSKIVRLGSRSADETIARYSLEQMEMIAGKGRLDKTFAREYRKMKMLEEELKQLMVDFLRRDVESSKITAHIELEYPEESDLLMYGAPAWITSLHEVISEYDAEGWQTAGSKKGAPQDNSLYAFWRQGRDLEYVHAALRGPVSKGKQKAPANKYNLLSQDQLDPDEDGDEELTLETADMVEEIITAPEAAEEENLPEGDVKLKYEDLLDHSAFFSRFDVNEVPSLPSTNRSVEELLNSPDPWLCSLAERQRLHDHWSGEVKVKLENQEVESFRKLREQHAQALANYNEGRIEVRRQLLTRVDIIGATTTGASKLTALLKGVGPRVLLVEEAGQVLEAHILASLVPSVEHLICIGDPLQLRPTLNNYALSMDSKRGAALYRFDMSLMERLAAELQMSQIDVQRRMRPSISSLIRHTLYPKLQDHELTMRYESVRGFSKNVFFLHHENKENGEGDESSSKYNLYEVSMIKDLVLYLLRQGCYSKEGDIVVLCAYLGQLARLREALAKEVAVVVDERDEEKLAAQEDDSEAKVDANIIQNVERVQVSRRVRLRTVDNYQGEEGQVVILSLVRNSGLPRADVIQERVTIGFLQSENRTNVALSRAKQGLYIFGNKRNLSLRSPMWASVIEQLDASGAVGDALPVACAQHPHDVHEIRQPGELPRFAPDGGCLRPCEVRLTCGHQCPFKCHGDDPHHVSVLCAQPCTRHCPKGHPCHKQCSDPCGACQFPITNVVLPCGHVKSSVPCAIMESLEEVRCNVLVEKKLPSCEHSARVACSMSPSQVSCAVKCAVIRPCCGKACLATCAQCQSLNVAEDILAGTKPITRQKHRPHPCEKTLFCGHRCANDCAEDHTCTEICLKACRQTCVHSSCREPCSTPCAPCQKPCTWICSHFSCPVPCGSVCARLPCDIRCEKILNCGHRCPSVCGEDCAQQQCKRCATPDQLTQVVDFILYRALEDLEPEQGTLDELSITLACRHTFTVETLDGHCHLTDYYSRDESTGAWLNPIAPSSDFMSPPACPTCRAPITASRYGRVVKRANLDIIETNVGSRMTRSLNQLHATISQADHTASEGLLKTHASGTLQDAITWTEDIIERRRKNREATLSRTRAGILPEKAIDPGNTFYFSVPADDVKVWRKAAALFIRSYRQAVAVVGTRSSHIHAWESAYTAIFNNALEDKVKHPEKLSAAANPHALALRQAEQAVGQPKPAADSKYRVKAMCASIIIRFTMIDLATGLMEALGARSIPSVERRQGWFSFLDFMLRACIQDAEDAINISRGSTNHRQASEIAPIVEQGRLKQFNLLIIYTRQEGKMTESREALIEQAEEQKRRAQDALFEAVRLHRDARRGMEGEEAWIEEKLFAPGNGLIEEWDSIIRSIRMDTFYQPVTREENIAIIKALNFGTTGHFYRCPNGHAYVIGECGGAMERSRCPDCGAVIGGSSHRLDDTNDRAEDLRALAAEYAGARVEDFWAPR